MKQTITTIFCLSLFFSSCAGPVSQPILSDAHSPLSSSNPELADTDCSYFYFLWGKTAESEKRFDEAVEAYEKAIVCDESSDYVVKRLAVLLVRLDRKQQAVNWIEKIVADRPHDSTAKMLLANLYASIGEFDLAADIYIKVLEDDPENSEVMLMLGTLYISNLEYGNARKFLERLVETDPESSVGFQYLAKLYRELEYYHKAMAAYQKSLELNWLNSLAFEAAALYEKQKKFNKAISLYQKVLKDDYTNDAAAGRLVKIYMELGETEKALDVLHELRKYALDPQKVDFSIGRIFLDQKQYDQAITLFSKMLELYPDFELARSVLALTYYEKGDKQKAKELLLMVSRDAAGYEDALVMLLNIMREEKEYDEAITLIKETIKRRNQPENFELYPLMASLYRDKDDIESALEVFNQAVAEYPDEPSLYFEYGMFLERAGFQEEAMAQIETVLDLEPENPFALNYIGYTWADQGKNLELALEYIKQALSIKPDDGFIRDSLGWVYFKLGKIDLAIQELEKAAQIEPEDPTIREHVGDVYLENKNFDKALDFFNQSLELHEGDDEKQRVRDKIEGLKN